MTLLISIDRTSLSLGPLVLSGSEDGNALGVTNYTEPAIQARVTYAPDSAYVAGSVPLAATWQLSLLSFDAVTDQATSETASRALIATLRDAVSQFSFTVTVTVGGAPAETWACHMGSVTPTGPRSYTDLNNSDPQWAVSIPCQPVRGF